MQQTAAGATGLVSGATGVLPQFPLAYGSVGMEPVDLDQDGDLGLSWLENVGGLRVRRLGGSLTASVGGD